MSRKLVLSVLSIAIPLSIFSTQVNADSLNLYVGYADSLRPSGFFPNPFYGSPGVIYSGESPMSDTLDSGTLRIQNTGSTAITITNLQVTLNPGTNPTVFALWGAPVTITPGENAIYAQTNGQNFDSSDFGFLPTIGIDSTHPLGGCTNPGALSTAQQALCISNAPLVSFDENGTLVSYIDTGNVLDTFGYDFVNGSSDGNESINWNLIGEPVSRGGSAPEPSTFAMLGVGLALAGVGRQLIRRS